ncbi:acyl-CoA thioesterase [Mangrovimonas cancribranchiae]|uniref:Thioesterase family protein n=1 Tax=Mangrovimonas cancribranchiae TaxID=3080055 RepID=A0AAU6P3B1_9FLAO
MNTFSKNIVVIQNNLDQLNHVNNVQYVQWVQDIAEQHWYKETTEAIRSTYFWVMINHYIEYKKEAKLGETIIVTTYVEETKGVKSTRIVEFSNTENTLLAKSTTQWCFIDAKSKRPTRIPKDIAQIFS